ncbi:MAG: S-layer homology domain-containing protein, partial [Chloroflexi bacterium]|nr:S-layer homology domain-containing protein [Chloroflexota bacterium]
MYHLRRLPIFALILILLMAFLPSVPSTQNASALPQVQPNENDPYLDDAEIYAKNMGVSVEEALRRFHIQDAVGDLEAELSAKEAETFAGLWLEHSPEFRIVVQFTGDANQKIKPHITKEMVDILDVRTAKISLAELEKTQGELLSSLTDLEIHVESEINVYENNITLAIVEADKTRFDLAVQNGLLQLPDYVVVITIPKLGEPEANIYGGLAMNKCNTAFSVQDIYEVLGRGVTTAGHCSENYSLSYNGIGLPAQTWLKSGSYDVGFHTTPGFTVTNQFKAGNTDIRRVTAIKPRDNQAVGAYVCKYGVTTGYTCGHISSKTVYGNVNPPLAATFIRVDNTGGYNDLSSGGDSGGPWFLGTTAYGIHHASSGIDPNDAIYMAINYVGGLGVSVVLAPVFADVPWDYWAWQDIERLYNSGVTGGCSTNPMNYCPDNSVTRAQMAVFLLKGKYGSTYTPPAVGSSTGFNDVATNYWAAAWIKQLAAEGITSGCSWSPPLYCPESTTTHAQMAIFLLKSKHGSAYTPPAVGN